MSTFLGLMIGLLGSGQASAGGIFLYEVGTADVGLASAGYNARAQDASTVFTNPAGMTRLEGTQLLATAQVLWANTEFSIDPATSPGLGREDGDHAVGWDGWFPGSAAFLSTSVLPRLKVGFAMAGNFGLRLEYDNDWVGRYHVQKTTLLGISLLPSVAYQLTDKLSIGASLNAMYGVYKNQVAINNVDPAFGDGRLKLDDNDWGWGANVGVLYEIVDGTRIGLTWNSQVDFNFDAGTEFSGLAPAISNALASRGLLNARVKIGLNVPQQAMASLFTQLNERWALLASVGWQEWSKFGDVEIGIADSNNPTSLTTDLDFKDTWHGAAGVQYRPSEPWLLNFGVAYDSGFQGSEVSPLLPADWAWRFGAGAEQRVSETFTWGLAVEYIYGGTLDTRLQGRPVALGGRGNVVGSYNDTSTYFLSVYGSWSF